MTQLIAKANEPYDMPVVLKSEPPPIVKVVEPEWQTFEATTYIALCNTGCTGITKTGIDVRSTITHKGKRIVAVDPSVIPLGSTVEIRMADGKTIEAIAEDTGGDIKGQRIDLLVSTESTARQFGRQDVKLRIIEEEAE